MALNLDDTQFSSTLPSLRDGDMGSLDVNISGTVGAGATVTWSASKVFANSNRLVRYSLSQTPVPAGIPTAYTASDRLPLSILVGGANFSAYLGCTVAGDGTITSIAPNIYVTSTKTGFTVTVSVQNPNAGTMTMTSTKLTIFFTAFEVIAES